MKRAESKRRMKSSYWWDDAYIEASQTSKDLGPNIHEDINKAWNNFWAKNRLDIHGKRTSEPRIMPREKKFGDVGLSQNIKTKGRK